MIIMTGLKRVMMSHYSSERTLQMSERQLCDRTDSFLNCHHLIPGYYGAYEQ